MKVSTAALSFLILAAALGSQARVIHEAREPIMALERINIPISHGHAFQPSDCCISYTSRNIRCLFMDDYFETSSRCSRPGVIFVTKGGGMSALTPAKGKFRIA